MAQLNCLPSAPDKPTASTRQIPTGIGLSGQAPPHPITGANSGNDFHSAGIYLKHEARNDPQTENFCKGVISHLKISEEFEFALAA